MFLVEWKIWKEGKFWLVESKVLDVMTQGFTRNEALEMAIDAVRSLLDMPKYEAELLKGETKEQFFLGFSDPKPILSLMMERARGAANLTYEALCKKVDVASKSTVKSFLAGKHDPGVAKLQKYADAMNCDIELVLKKRA